MTTTRADMLAQAHEALPVLDELDDVLRRLGRLRVFPWSGDRGRDALVDLYHGSERLRGEALATIGDAHTRPDLYARDTADA